MLGALDIVVTGRGAISPLGMGVQAQLDGLMKGRSGITEKPNGNFDLSPSAVRRGGYIQDFEPEAYDSSKVFGRVARGTQFAIIAADEALAEAGYHPDRFPPEQVGIVFSTIRTAIEKTEEFYEKLITKGPRATAPLVFQETVHNASASHITLRHRITGPCVTLTSGGTGFFQAVAMAAGWLQRGLVRMVLVLGAEGLPAVYQIAHYHARGHAPVRAGGGDECCPFDRRRNGYLLSEGAVAFVLEPRMHAEQRGANSFGRVAGWGFAHDAYRVGRYHPAGQGLEQAMGQALSATGWSRQGIDWILASASASPVGDAAEARALHRLWQTEGVLPQVSAVKSMLGEMEAAWGGFGLLAALLGMEHEVLFPTINYREPDPECAIDCVPNEAVDAAVKRVLINALGFGGGAAAMIVERS